MIPRVSPSPHIFEATGPGETASVEPSYLEEAKISMGKMGRNTWFKHGNMGETMIPSGNLTVCYGKSQFLMGKLTISMAIFNSLPEGNHV